MKIEILSPVGNFTSLIAAQMGGADSVYFGIGNLNMRSHSANNFTKDDLKKIVKYCQKHKIKTYLTVNTIMYDKDLNNMKEICNLAKKEKVDAIIASDIATISYANSIGLKIHLSTQLNICNIETIKFFSKFANAIVLARELDLSQIKYICETIKKEKIKGPNNKLIKIEIFCHGALCVAISGKCYMSLAQYNKSANKGKCLQPCRRKYRVFEEETKKELLIDNKYIMSPKDLCTISFLDQILKTGASILKIEGRARSPEYVKTVTRTYKNAILSIKNNKYDEKKKKFLEDLNSVYNRGFWSGYYLKTKQNPWSETHGSKATKKKKYIGKITNYFSKVKVCELLMQSGSLKIGDDIIIEGNLTGSVDFKIKNIRKKREIKKANKGDTISFKIDKKIRKNDKLYLVENS